MSNSEEKLNAQKEQLLVQQQIETTKSSVLPLTLPCGYLAPDGKLHREVVVREMTGREEDLLASKGSWLKKSNELFSRCVERIGSIVNKDQIAAAVPELLVGDRTFLTFAIRRVSLGDMYVFRMHCPECKKESLFEVDLSDLQVREMPDPMRRQYDQKLSSGMPFRFHLLKGADQSKLEDIEDNQKKLTYALIFRLDSLDDRSPTVDAVQALSTRHRDELRIEFEKVDGGVDTEMQLSCPKCDEEFSTDIEVGPSFFFPSVMRKNSKKKSST